MLTLRDPERCPKCAGDSRVIDSRHEDNTRRRRRQCKACGKRWDTYESLIDPNNVRLHGATSPYNI